MSGQLFFILTVWLALSGHSRSQSSSVHDGQSQKRKHRGRECPSGLTRSINTYCWVYLSSDHPFQVHYKARQLILSQSAIVCYYKVPKVLLQSATGITKCEKFITKCDRYYNPGLQRATEHGGSKRTIL